MLLLLSLSLLLLLSAWSSWSLLLWFYLFILLFHQHQLSKYKYIMIERFELGHNVGRNRHAQTRLGRALNGSCCCCRVDPSGAPRGGAVGGANPLGALEVDPGMAMLPWVKLLLNFECWTHDNFSIISPLWPWLSDYKMSDSIVTCVAITCHRASSSLRTPDASRGWCETHRQPW